MRSTDLNLSSVASQVLCLAVILQHLSCIFALHFDTASVCSPVVHYFCDKCTARQGPNNPKQRPATSTQHKMSHIDIVYCTINTQSCGHNRITADSLLQLAAMTLMQGMLGTTRSCKYACTSTMHTQLQHKHKTLDGCDRYAIYLLS